jgi:hypothetical protein
MIIINLDNYDSDKDFEEIKEDTNKIIKNDKRKKWKKKLRITKV